MLGAEDDGELEVDEHRGPVRAAQEQVRRVEVLVDHTSAMDFRKHGRHRDGDPDDVGERQRRSTVPPLGVAGSGLRRPRRRAADDVGERRASGVGDDDLGVGGVRDQPRDAAHPGEPPQDGHLVRHPAAGIRARAYRADHSTAPPRGVHPGDDRPVATVQHLPRVGCLHAASGPMLSGPSAPRRGPAAHDCPDRLVGRRRGILNAHACRTWDPHRCSRGRLSAHAAVPSCVGTVPVSPAGAVPDCPPQAAGAPSFTATCLPERVLRSAPRPLLSRGTFIRDTESCLTWAFLHPDGSLTRNGSWRSGVRGCPLRSALGRTWSDPLSRGPLGWFVQQVSGEHRVDHGGGQTAVDVWGSGIILAMTGLSCRSLIASVTDRGAC